MSKSTGNVLAILGIIVTIFLIEIRGIFKLDFYDSLKSADSYFDIQEFEEARKYYLEALKYDSNSEYCKIRIEECKQKTQFKNEIKLADKYYSSNNFKLALKHYELALQYDLYNKYCLDQIDKSKEFLRKNQKQSITKNTTTPKPITRKTKTLKKEKTIKKWPTKFQILDGYRIGVYYLEGNSYYYNKAKVIVDKLINNGYPKEYVGLKPRSYEQMNNNIRNVKGLGYEVRYHESNEKVQGLDLKRHLDILFPSENIETEALKGTNDFTPKGLSIIVYIEE